jgi:hypothetical protein
VTRTLAVASLAALVSIAALAVPAPSAEARVARHWRPVAVSPVSITVEAHDGRALPSVMHGGQMFVAGEQGERYEIRLTNNSGDRVEVVLSVDGRDAVSGRMADFRTQRGYVLEPFSSVSIDGFRTSMSSVAAFRFTSPGESFTGRHGTPGNAGVIGMAVFKERRQAIARAPMKRRAASGFVPFDAERKGGESRADEASRPAPKASTSAPSRDLDRAERSADGRSMARPRRQDLGTGFGEERFSAAREVTFVRASKDRPDFITTIQYDSAHALADRGVPIEPEPAFAVDPRPNAWPGARDDRFTQAPPPRRF